MRFRIRGHKPKDFVGKGIRWWINSDVVHISSVFGEDSDGEEWETLPGEGLHKQSPVKFGPDDGIEISFEVDIADAELALEWLRANEGTEYSISKIASFIFPFVKRHDHAYICSEVAYIICQKMGILFPSSDVVLTPIELVLLASQEDFRRKVPYRTNGTKDVPGETCVAAAVREDEDVHAGRRHPDAELPL